MLTFSTSTLDSRTPSFVVFSATVPETALNADTSTLFERSDCNTPIFVVASATSFAKPDSELPTIAVNSATSADKSAGIPKLALNALTLIPILLSDVILIYSSLGVYSSTNEIAGMSITSSFVSVKRIVDFPSTSITSPDLTTKSEKLITSPWASPPASVTNLYPSAVFSIPYAGIASIISFKSLPWFAERALSEELEVRESSTSTAELFFKASRAALSSADIKPAEVAVASERFAIISATGIVTASGTLSVYVL